MFFEQHQLAVIIRYMGAGQCYRISGFFLAINCHNTNLFHNGERLMKQCWH